MHNHLLASFILSLVFLTFAPSCFAGDVVRKIKIMGCHEFDSTCFADIEGPTVGGEFGCSSTSIRWDTNSGGGKNQLAILTSAFISGKCVGFHISGCYSKQNAFPTFAWSWINE